jgi:hypothetical protein
LAGFEGQRACDRRLKILIEAGYIDRKKILYGVPSLYFLTHKGKMLIGANKRQDKIRVEKIPHDTAVVDTVIYFVLKHNISLDKIVTEKEINSQAGFGTRKHVPDFIIESENKKICIEVELSLKSKARFEKIVGDNYLNFSKQLWLVTKSGHKIRNILDNLSAKYPNIGIMNLEEVQQFVKHNK